MLYILLIRCRHTKYLSCEVLKSSQKRKRKRSILCSGEGTLLLCKIIPIFMTLKASRVINMYRDELSYISREQMTSRSLIACEAALVYAALKII